MKFTNISFPHPVLGIGDSINGHIELGSPGIETAEDSYNVSLNLKYTNSDINNLQKNGKAHFLCEVTCTNTLFRKSISSDSNKIKFSLPKKALKGRVEFVCLLVAKTDIHEYTNSNSHSDYNGYTFGLEKGDVLAYFGEFSFNADVKYEKLKAVSSFMEIVENSDLTYTNIDIKKSKIQVELPSKTYDLFRGDSISQEPRFSPVFHSSMVLNALLTALYNYNEHRDYLWAEVIEYRLANEKKFKNLSIQEKENIPEIAQRLLGNPFHRLLEGLKVITESKNLYQE